MKRFFKTTLSVLIVAIMLVQLFPVQLLFTPASAAGNPVYQYKAVTSLTPGKTYIVANKVTSSGSVNVLTAGSGAESTASGMATLQGYSSGGSYYLTPSGDMSTYEWALLAGNAIGANNSYKTPATYMLQNVKTGAYLYNPVYDAGDGSSTFVTLDPLSDEYSPYTRQVYNSQQAINSYLQSTTHTGFATYSSSEPSWIRVGTTTYGGANNDPTVYFNLGNQTGYNDLTSVFYMANMNGSLAEMFTFFNTAPNGSFYEYNMGTSHSTTWRGFVLSDAVGSSYLNSNTNFVNYRFDLNKSGGYLYLSSTFLTKNIYARVALYYYRYNLACYGENGYYPSQRYPFCQFNMVHTGNYNFRVANFDANVGQYAQQYYYGWTSDKYARSWNNSANYNNTVFYEKQLVEDADYTWNRITSLDQIKTGAEYIITNQSGTAENVILFKDNGGTVGFEGLSGTTYSGYDTVSGVLMNEDRSSSVSTVPDAAVWVVRKVGNYFYLQNKATGRNLYNAVGDTVGNSNGNVPLYTFAQGSTGGVYGHRYIWSYENPDTTNSTRLRAHHVAQNAGEAAVSVGIGYASGQYSADVDNTCYLYVKTYCPHNNTVVKSDTQPTCTTDGLYWVYCNDCSGDVEKTVRPALGHDYNVVVTDPTCTDRGYTTRTCKRNCGETNATVVDSYVDALGHAEETIPGTPATCNSTGLTDGKKCSRCGITLQEQTVIPKLEHDWQVTSTEGTCGQVGVTNYTCSLCGETKREEGAVIDHNYSQVVTPPDCDDEGYTTHTCSKCGDSYTDTPVAALGHSYGSWYTVTHATTTSDGLERRDCTRCDHYETQIIPMLESAKLKGSEVTTEPGETVTIDVELRGNPGIWGMNFVVYWPEALTFVKAESSDEAFPLGDIEGNENEPVDPTTNERMAAYFADANIPNPGNYMAFAYYVDNGGFENNYNNGKIISITFTLPENNCLKEYPIGLFGVYASSGNDVINADGDTVADFSYVDGKIIVPNGIDCPHTDYTVVTDKEATCTTDGARHKVCNNCGHEFGHEVLPALTHSYGEPVLIREPSGLSAGIMRQTCSRCGHYIDTEVLDKPATGEGISASVNGEQYKYYITTRMYPGREYMFLSNQHEPSAGVTSAYAMGLDAEGNIYSAPVTFNADGTVSNNNNALVWNSSTGLSFSNDAYGKWLTASLVSYENVSADENYSNNLYVSDTPYDNSKYTSFGHRGYDSTYTSESMYLGFGDLSTSTAHAEDYYLQLGNYALLKTDKSSYLYTSSDINWYLEFDLSFSDASSFAEIYRDDDIADVAISSTHASVDFGLRIEPGLVSLIGPETAGNIYGQVTTNNVVTNTKVVASQAFGSIGAGETHEWGFSHWHHFKIDYTDGTLRIFADGVELTDLRQTNYNISLQRSFFFNTPDHKVGIDNLLAKGGHTYQSNGVWVYPNDGYVFIHETFPENFNEIQATDNHPDKTSGWDGYDSSTAVRVDAGSSGEAAVLLKENTFYASENDHNSVFIYEKRLENEMSMIYQLAEGLESGESYVLVRANTAGTSTILKAETATQAATQESITVYEDGVSIAPNADTYVPYVDLLSIGTTDAYDNSSESVSFKHEYASEYEFFATAAGEGFLLNYVPVNVQENRPTEGTFLTTNGKLTSSATDANIITVVDGKVTIAGEEYYVYKKVCVDLIDTAYENDMAVVDFGFGFNLNADFFRDNDPWADRVDVTLTGIAASIGAKKNEWFYPAGTRVGGAGNSATVANGTATFNGGISFTNSGKYESIVTVDYEGKVEHLGAYMYSTLYIIPATSVYYEDDASFISYTNSNNIADGRGAWETVAGDSPVVDVLDAQYGNSTTHSSYLQYSGNSVHKVAVGPSNVPSDYADGWMPSASFTFTGTGFDVISAIGRTTCAVFVEITGATEEYYVVDNYLGYSYDDENGWVPTTGTTAIQLYQVPVIKWENDTGVPATYNVKISVAYDEFFDHADVGYSEFYLDGIRVYNPVDITKAENEVALNKYMEDNELIISEDNLRRLLITNASEQLENGQTLSGALFIDGANLTNTTNDFANYNEVGAANEITLTAASGIAFTVTSDSQPAKVALGIKVSNGGAASVLVSSGAKSTTIATATATDMYYDITEGVEWKQSAGKYSANIVITNSSASALVSLTNLKLTTGAAEPVSVEYSVSTKTENIAYRTLASLYGVNGEEFVVGDVYDTKTVNGLDTLTLKKYLTGNATLDAREYAAADINGDGLVNAMDALLLKKLMMN